MLLHMTEQGPKYSYSPSVMFFKKETVFKLRTKVMY